MSPDQEHQDFIDRKLTATEDLGPASDEAALTLVQWAIAWTWISTLSDIRELPEASGCQGCGGNHPPCDCPYDGDPS